MKLLGENVKVRKVLKGKNGFYLIYFTRESLHTYNICELNGTELKRYCQYARQTVEHCIEYIDNFDAVFVDLSELDTTVDAVYSLTRDEALLHLAEDSL